MAERSRSRRGGPRRNHTLQLIGIVLLALVIVEGLLGSALMTQRPFAAGTLSLHILVALVTVGVTGWTFRLALRRRGWRPFAAAGLALLSALGATVAGADYLLGGKTPTALHWMEGLTGAVLVAAVLLLVWGAATMRGAQEPAPTATRTE